MSGAVTALGAPGRKAGDTAAAVVCTSFCAATASAGEPGEPGEVGVGDERVNARVIPLNRRDFRMAVPPPRQLERRERSRKRGQAGLLFLLEP